MNRYAFTISGPPDFGDTTEVREFCADDLIHAINQLLDDWYQDEAIVIENVGQPTHVHQVDCRDNPIKIRRDNPDDWEDVDNIPRTES